MERLLELVNARYPLAEVDAGKYGSFQVAGMDFETAGYDAAGLGNVSVMKAFGMGGAMKMTSVIINPFAVDAPLLNIDRIEAMGTDSLYAELYDTCLNAERKPEPFLAVAEEYKDIPDVETGPNWYDDICYGASIVKKATAAESPRIDACIDKYFAAYLDLLASAEPCDYNAKHAKAHEYSDGLLEHGGPATDAFLKDWGQEKTREFFDTVLFG